MKLCTIVLFFFSSKFHPTLNKSHQVPPDKDQIKSGRKYYMDLLQEFAFDSEFGKHLAQKQITVQTACIQLLSHHVKKNYRSSIIQY